MPQPPNDLLHSLGRLVRGLSALFWGLPIALIICFNVDASRAEILRMFGVVPPLVATGLLVFGLWEMGDFQRQERVWRNALDRARVLGLICFGLSPFLFWHGRDPDNAFFLAMRLALIIAGWLFLGSLNLVLRRLGAMLPDETLRQEIKQFTVLNLYLLLATFLLGSVAVGVGRMESLPLWLASIANVLSHRPAWISWGLVLLLLLVLVPLAMTMALLWKTKEVILESVFGAKE